MKRSTRPGLVALVFMLTIACSLRLGGNTQQIIRQGRALFGDEIAKELERGVIYVTPLMTLTPTPTPTLTPTLTLSASAVDGSGLQVGPGGAPGSSGSGGNGSGGSGGGSVPAGVPSPPQPPTLPATSVPTLPPTLAPTGTSPATPIGGSPSPTPNPGENPSPTPDNGNTNDDDDDDGGSNTPPPAPLSVAFRSASYTVDEFDSFAAIEVSLNRTAAQSVTVLYTTIDDTASSPDDYSASGGQLTFPPGVTSQSFNVDIIDDMDIEGPETIQLHLGSPINANLGTPNQASLTIGDDDFPGVQFSSPSYSATEASGSAIITVTLTSTAPFVVTVDYATSDGAAASGSDYTAATGTLTFNPNVTALSFNIPVLKDALIETDETVNLALSNPIKANLGLPAAAVLTIVDSTLSQLTVTTGCLSNLAPASNGDGTRLIFRSDCDPLGANADGSFEIFLFDTTSDMLTQLTTSMGCDNTFATINDNGTLIAFDSTCDPFGTNIDLNPELMLLDTSTSALTQLTDTSDCFNQETSINAAGTRIAFRSNCNPLGSNGNFNDEIFLFNTSTSALSQLTTTAGCLNAEPSISADGTRIVFSSNCDPLASNGDLNLEIFLFDTSANMLSQLTTTMGCQSLAPSISDDGTHVALRTSCDPGSNPDGNFEIGLVDVASVMLTQLTITVGCNNFAPASNIGATRVAFYSNCDPLGSNGDNNFELFLSNTGILNQITQTIGCGNQDPVSDNSGTRITYTSDCDPLGANADGNFEIFQAILN
jgi:hypothetical protein